MSKNLYDKTGRQIYPGDVLKVYHFRAAVRREHRYMYKYVSGVHENGNALIVEHLQPGTNPYYLPLNGKIMAEIEIVQGYAGVPSGCDYRDRARLKRSNEDAD